MHKYITLKEPHKHSDKGCELYFVSTVEPSSVLPRICMEICFISATTVGLVVVVVIPALFWDGGTAQTTIQVHAVNLIELG